MNKIIDVMISPYIPLSPDLSSLMPINGYFSVSFKYDKDTLPAASSEKDIAYKNPTVTLGGFVRKDDNDTSAIFNTSDELAAFADTLQFEDTSMYNHWTILKPDENGQLKIVKKTASPLPDDFVCTLYSIKFNPTNLKGKDNRAILTVNTKDFKEGFSDEYQLSSKKIYISDILSFSADKTNAQLNDPVTLSWNARGDYINAAQLQINAGKPMTVAISGNYATKITCPSIFQLTVQNKNPNAPFHAASYAVVDLLPPVIDAFTADTAYAGRGQPVSLSWETHSAYSCQINGQTTSCGITGHTTVTPDFTLPGCEKETVYRLTANGYSGKQPYSVWKDLRIVRTYWENRGIITGIDLSSCTSASPGKILFDSGKSYLFNGTALYSADNNLSYTLLSTLPLPKDFTVNQKYKCGFFEGCFYVAGLQSNTDIYISAYRISDNTWTDTWLSDIGEKCLNGCFAGNPADNLFYYIFAIDNTVYMFEKTADSWTWVGQSVFNHTITACDCCFWRDKLSLSLLCADKQVRNYYITGYFDKIVESSVIYTAQSSVSLAPTNNDVLILGDTAVYCACDGKHIDICYEEKLFTGIHEEPIVIRKTNDKIQLYQLHTKEM